MEYHIFMGFFAALSRAAGFRFMAAQGKEMNPKLFEAYCWFTDIAMAFYVLRIVSRVALPMTFDQCLEWIPTLLYVGQVFLKGVMLRINNSRIMVCVDNMERFFKMVNLRDREKFAAIWKSQYHNLNLFCKVMFWNQMVCLVLTFSPSFYNTIANPSATFLNFPAYHFFYDRHYAFKVSYLFIDYITSNFCCMKTSCIEMLYLTFVSYYIAILKYLRNELDDTFQDFENGLDFKRNLQWWYRTHQDALRQIILFKELVRSLLLIIYVYNLTNIITMTVFVTANGDMEFSQKLIAIVVVGVTLLYFFWDCILTDELEALHSNMLSCAFKARLSETNVKDVKQSVMFSTLRCRYPVNISAGGFFSPSCWNFKELMASTGSLLVGLWEIKNRVQHGTH